MDAPFFLKKKRKRDKETKTRNQSKFMVVNVRDLELCPCFSPPFNFEMKLHTKMEIYWTVRWSSKFVCFVFFSVNCVCLWVEF